MSRDSKVLINYLYEWSYRVGGVLPLYSKKNIDILSPLLLFLIALGNFILRFVTYPLSFAFILFFAITSITVAIVYNLIFLLGGIFNDSWYHMTGEYNQMAIKSCLWVISDLISFLVDQTNLFMGLFSSTYAIKTLTYLKNQINELPDNILTESDWDVPYLKQVMRFGSFIQGLGFREAGMAIVTLLSEPVNAVFAGIRMQKGLSDYPINPTSLNEVQRSQIPVLLIHGDQHDDTAFAPLLYKLYQEKYEGPIFTVNIPNMQDEGERSRIIDTKINEIDRLYDYKKRGNEKHIRCLCIGHSSGADTLVEQKGRDATTKRLLILMGAVKHIPEQPEKKTSLVYFNAKTDVVLSMPSETRDNIEEYGEVHTVNTGHLGLLSHQTVLQRCYDLLVSKDTKTFFSSMPKETIDDRTESNLQIPSVVY